MCLTHNNATYVPCASIIQYACPSACTGKYELEPLSTWTANLPPSLYDTTNRTRIEADFLEQRIRLIDASMQAADRARRLAPSSSSSSPYMSATPSSSISSLSAVLELRGEYEECLRERIERLNGNVGKKAKGLDCEETAAAMKKEKKKRGRPLEGNWRSNALRARIKDGLKRYTGVKKIREYLEERREARDIKDAHTHPLRNLSQLNSSHENHIHTLYRSRLDKTLLPRHLVGVQEAGETKEAFENRMVREEEENDRRKVRLVWGEGRDAVI